LDASCLHISNPIPLLPPVTTATLYEESNQISHSRGKPNLGLTSFEETGDWGLPLFRWADEASFHWGKILAGKGMRSRSVWVEHGRSARLYLCVRDSKIIQ
jgi:hypothetical protein